MKPTNWTKLPESDKSQIALELFSSHRGIYLMSQAIHYALITMKIVPDPLKETSNIQDLEILREMVFNYPVGILPEDLPEDEDGNEAGLP